MTATRIPPTESAAADGAISIRRYVNDEIADTAFRFGANDGSRFEFVCECGELSCKAVVTMTLAEYRLRGPGSVVGH
jgi:hypothetical protein